MEPTPYALTEGRSTIIYNMQLSVKGLAFISCQHCTIEKRHVHYEKTKHNKTKKHQVSRFQVSRALKELVSCIFTTKMITGKNVKPFDHRGSVIP